MQPSSQDTRPTRSFSQDDEYIYKYYYTDYDTTYKIIIDDYINVDGSKFKPYRTKARTHEDQTSWGSLILSIAVIGSFLYNVFAQKKRPAIQET